MFPVKKRAFHVLLTGVSRIVKKACRFGGYFKGRVGKETIIGIFIGLFF